MIGRRREPDVARVDADRLRRLLLPADIDVGRGVVSDEHGDEAHVPELGEFFTRLFPGYRTPAAA